MKLKNPAEKKGNQTHITYLTLDVGNTIEFTPTGEKLRVAMVEEGGVILEKLEEDYEELNPNKI